MSKQFVTVVRKNGQETSEGRETSVQTRALGAAIFLDWSSYDTCSSHVALSHRNLCILPTHQVCFVANPESWKSCKINTADTTCRSTKTCNPADY